MGLFGENTYCWRWVCISMLDNEKEQWRNRNVFSSLAATVGMETSEREVDVD